MSLFGTVPTHITEVCGVCGGTTTVTSPFATAAVSDWRKEHKCATQGGRDAARPADRRNEDDA